MSDWPALPQPSAPFRCMNTLGPWSAFGDFATTCRIGAATAGVWPSANLAIYMPTIVPEIFTPITAVIHVSVQSGNVDVGIYDEGGSRLWSAGTTAVAVAGTQTFTVAGITLNPGLYYLAMACDNVTASFFRFASATISRPIGSQQQATAFVLPSTSTPVIMTFNYHPVLSFHATTA